MGLLALMFGGSFLAMRVAVDEIGPLTVVLHRVGWAALILWVVVLIQRRAVPRSPGLWAAFVVMGLLNNVIPFALIAWGQLYVETGLASILNAATAIFGVLVATFFFADERLTLARAVGVGLGFLGVAMATGIENLAALDVRSLGQIAIIAATGSYAFAAAWGRARLSHLPPAVAAAGMLTASTVIIAPAAVMVEGAPRFDLAPATWAGIGYGAGFATAFAFLLYYRVLAKAGSGNLMLTTLLVPPFAIGLGAWARDEALSPSAFAGFALIALGLLVLNGTIPLPGQHRARRP